MAHVVSLATKAPVTTWSVATGRRVALRTPALFRLLLERRQREELGQVEPLAIPLDLRERLGPRHRGERAARQFLVAPRPFDLPGELLLGQRADHLRRDARHEHARRHAHA